MVRQQAEKEKELELKKSDVHTKGELGEITAYLFGSLVPSPSHPSFISQPCRNSEGEGLVPLITCRDVCTRRVGLYAHALVKNGFC